MVRVSKSILVFVVSPSLVRTQLDDLLSTNTRSTASSGLRAAFVKKCQLQIELFEDCLRSFLGSAAIVLHELKTFRRILAGECQEERQQVFCNC